MPTLLDGSQRRSRDRLGTGRPITTPRSAASETRSGSSGRRPERRQHRVRQGPVPRHRRLRVSSDLHPPRWPASPRPCAGSRTPINFYTVGGNAGANQTPQTIEVTFNSPIDPNSINVQTVMLEARLATASAATATRATVHQPGRQAVVRRRDPHLVINLGGSGLTLPTDAYRLILLGSGSQVLPTRRAWPSTART